VRRDGLGALGSKGEDRVCEERRWEAHVPHREVPSPSTWKKAFPSRETAVSFAIVLTEAGFR
jgi:hypothetical protein